MKTVRLEFDGYWREVNKGGIPAKSGVYLVYVCKYNESKNTVSIDKLIYIGESQNVRERIKNHEKWSEWRRHVPRGSTICFSFAEAIKADHERSEAALIHYHKPPCNDNYIDSFPYETTTVISSGRCALISSPITVRKKVKHGSTW